jgi:aminomethyltransferase
MKTEALQRTPLHALHAELGARFTPFAGYEMPVQYREGLRAEHLHTRSHAGLFDVSHMGQIRIAGPNLYSSLEKALPVDLDDWPEGLQRYSVLLNERGGIEDDLMVTRLPDEVRLVVNAACKEKDLAVLRTVCPGLKFELLDAALIALQGPAAEAAFPEAGGLPFMRAARYGKYFVSRSGYTGEDGFEIAVAPAEAGALARRLLSNPAVKPVGLGARDTLRLEAGLHLYGQDMDENTTPLEASLGWAIARSRRAGGRKEGGFLGAGPYLQQLRDGGKRRLIGLIGEEAVPIRHGALLVKDDGAEVGVVTSGTISPSTQKAIMLGYVSSALPEEARLFAVVRDSRRPVRISKLPFVPKRYKK